MICSLSPYNYYQGDESEYPGRESKKILHPDDLFLNNINDYRYNRFLDIGMNIISHSNIHICLKEHTLTFSGCLKNFFLH